MSLNNLTFKDFKMLAILKDQTEIVKFLLANDTVSDLQDFIYNGSDVTITFPFEVKTLPSSHYYDIVDQNGHRYNDLVKELELNKSNASDLMIEIEQLKELSLFYEEAAFKERTIYEWRLIPHWLGDHLLSKGETILRAYGNDWVGIRKLDQSGALYFDFLAEVYNELPP